MIPEKHLAALSPEARAVFDRWDRYMHTRVRFNMPQSKIHTHAHCERVLLYALMLGDRIFGSDPEALEALAHAAIFHDTRRRDDYRDRGHGARAAVYYGKFAHEHPDELTLHPESTMMMRYHDLNDGLGHKRIAEAFDGPAEERAHRLYEIFKDADALDRWRLGDRGLDTRFLRTPEAREMTRFARRVVRDTMDPALLSHIDRLVRETMGRHGGPRQ